MNGAIDEPALLMEVPPVLKRLAKLVARGFYEDEHVALINVLTNAKHPCVKEEDLIEMLKFEKRQLRQVIVRLKNDKLIKQRVHKEKQRDTGTMLSFNYYFINYKLFVNVVRYKLDHIRKKIESEEKQAKNRPSFLCTQCASKYSDLEVDRLIDMMTGLLKCTYCSGTVEEDVSEIQQSNSSRTSLARFNEQLEQIFLLLKESENINLAPQILEPEPDLTSINIHASRSSGIHGHRTGWANDRRDIDGGNLGIKISMGPEDDDSSDNAKRAKEAPIWMKESTVGPTEDIKASNRNITSTTTSAPHTSTTHKDDEILADLLAHESVSKKPRLDVVQALGQESESSDDSDDENMSAVPAVSQDKKVTETMEEGDSDGDDEIKIKIGGKMVVLHEVTGAMIESMTQQEHDAYNKACKEAYSDIF